MAARHIPSETKTRPARLQARLPAEVKTIIKRAAEISGQSLSAFVVSSALEAAEETIRRREVVVLSERDSIVFVAALLNPKGPSDALRAAARRHREMFGS